MKNLILIDFSWLYNRYYFVAKQNNTDTSITNIPNIVTDMLTQFLSIVGDKYSKAKVILALDSPTTSLKNFEIYPEYKQNRDKEVKKEVYKEIDFIIARLVKSLDNKRFAFIKAKNYEADQIIAYFVKKYKEESKIIIYSGDKDLLQLTYHKNVRVSNKFKDGRFILMSDEEIFEKFKNNKGENFTRVSENKKDILKYRALKGDSSDNLSPVFPRIKDKEIIQVIQDYWVDDQEEGLSNERIEKILEELVLDNPSLAEKLEANKDIWLRNYQIMNLLNVGEIELRRLSCDKNNS